MAKKSVSAKVARKVLFGGSRDSDLRDAEIESEARASNILQLRRARGQVDGIERMITEDRYCADIIVQVTAARASLQVVANGLLEAHLKACHKAAMEVDGAGADKMYQELVGLVSKMTK